MIWLATISFQLSSPVKAGGTTAATAGGCTATTGGPLSESVTTLSVPGMWQISEVYSAT